jgi:hypothetical protein
MWRARFGRVFGPVVRQTAKWIMNLEMSGFQYKCLGFSTNVWVSVQMDCRRIKKPDNPQSAQFTLKQISLNNTQTVKYKLLTTNNNYTTTHWIRSRAYCSLASKQALNKQKVATAY